MTPQKTPISKKWLGLFSFTNLINLFPQSEFNPVLRQYFLNLKSNKFYENASTHVPLVEALEYSVALPSKKFMCSTALSIVSNQVNGFFLTS